MKMRTKSALVVFIGLAVAFIVDFSIDYTDRYVSDRFHEAVLNAPVGTEESFSLDAFLQYYDWDSVCVVLPGSEHDFTTLLGRAYAHRATNLATWSLVFLKEGTVTAEISIDRAFLDHPKHLDEFCFDRWCSVFFLNRDEKGRPYLAISGY